MVAFVFFVASVVVSVGASVDGAFSVVGSVVGFSAVVGASVSVVASVVVAAVSFEESSVVAVLSVVSVTDSAVVVVVVAGASVFFAFFLHPAKSPSAITAVISRSRSFRFFLLICLPSLRQFLSFHLFALYYSKTCPPRRTENRTLLSNSDLPFADISYISIFVIYSLLVFAVG